MKKRVRYFNYIILFMFCLVCGGFTLTSSTFAGVNDFYFSDFTGDYYLNKNESGTNVLKVKESVTAVFPDYNQNKGICRQIPFTNQNGKNLTLKRLTRDDIIVTRNGIIEPIYSINKEGNYYNVCTGTEEYVLGKQTYVFEYQFENVVTTFDNYQELYWDTNGNGAMQRFDSVTARLHFNDKNVWSGKSWCYVGKYGSNNQERCTISEISDGVEFKATDLLKFENLTFDVELKQGSFVIPEPEKDYTYVIILAVLAAVCLLIIIHFLKKFLGSREKAGYYKGIFVAPQYQPSKDYSLPEMVEVYLDKKKDVKVAMLLEMVVKKKISLKKEDKHKWSLIVDDLNEVGEEYIDLLSILNNGTRPNEGDEIKIERHAASNRLISIKKSMEGKILRDLKRDKLVEEKYNIGGGGKRGIGNVITMTVVIVPVVIMFGLFIMGISEDLLGLDNTIGKDMIFYEYFYQTALALIVITVIVCVSLNDSTQKYINHTNKGLEMSRYMDGLKLYIEMAEAERMKMLQSIEGVDTSANGIIKLYEKLLPYAAVFGLEESWMNEMKQYCEVEEIEEPDYLMTGFATNELIRSLHNAASFATTSTVMSSSGGGSSSGFSGGGGGGFSGGGGGGGGFSGR